MTTLEHFMLGVCFVTAASYLIGTALGTLVSFIMNLIESHREKKRIAKEVDRQ